MPLFIDNKTNIAVYRAYKYNVEYLDGLLDLLPDDSLCHIIAHVPNRRFGYDIGIIKTLTAIQGWEEVNNLGHYNSNLPAKAYYELIPKDRYGEYAKNNNFYTNVLYKEGKDKEEGPKKVLKTQFNIPSIEKEKTNLKESLSTKSKLVRNTERAVYTYKTPGQRYGDS